MMEQFNFSLAQPADRALIEGWLTRTHIREWLHGDGLETTLRSLVESTDEPSEFQHWIADDGDAPFGYLLTSTADPSEEEYASVPFSANNIITLDVFIGEPDFLGKGFGTAMILAFLRAHFPDVSDVLIDPEVANARAVHVYQKLGFRIIETFIAPWHRVPHYLMHLNSEDLQTQFNGMVE